MVWYHNYVYYRTQRITGTSLISTSLAERRSTDRHRPRQSNDRHAWYHMSVWDVCVVNDSHRRHPTHHPSIIWTGHDSMHGRHTAVAIGLAMQSIETGWWSAAEAKCCHVADYPQPTTLAADATTLPSVYRSLRTINRFENFLLFSRVTLIRKLQSTSDLDHFHPRELPCSCVKSDPISGRWGDSGFCSPLYID